MTGIMMIRRNTKGKMKRASNQDAIKRRLSLFGPGTFATNLWKRIGREGGDVFACLLTGGHYSALSFRTKSIARVLGANSLKKA
jgi:hypothetical protein